MSCNSGSKKDEIDPPEPPVDTPLVKLGAYYFGGWYENSHHLKPALVNDHPERKPTWGWVTQTQDIMVKEIDAAANAGLYFFSFCWYFNTADLSENRPATQAINRFASASNKKRLKFCLLVANHDGYRINPQNWPQLKEHWKKWFADEAYLKVDGKPLIIFFDINNMITNWGSVQKLKDAFNSFREEVKSAGLNGVAIAGCPSPTSQNGINYAVQVGCDALTGYNYHTAGFSPEMSTPVGNMASAEYNTLWPKFVNAGPYHIPVSTLNWDVRPWSDTPETEKYFTGFSKASVANSVAGIKKWILENPNTATKEKLGILYAWNEYGEGGWLTPSESLKDSLLQGLKEGLK